jgi:hypothetical protein
MNDEIEALEEISEQSDPHGNTRSRVGRKRSLKFPRFAVVGTKMGLLRRAKGLKQKRKITLPGQADE